MNLQHERMLSLCETLNLPYIAQGYAVASQAAAEKETAYSDFLEGLLKTEAAGRQVRKQSMLTRLAGFPAIKTLDELQGGVVLMADNGSGCAEPLTMRFLFVASHLLHSGFLQTSPRGLALAVGSWLSDLAPKKRTP